MILKWKFIHKLFGVKFGKNNIAAKELTFSHREQREAPLTLSSQRGINTCLCIKAGK